MVFDIDDASVDKTIVHNYLTANSLTPVTVSGDDDIYSQVEKLVAHFMATITGNALRGGNSKC